MLLIKEDLSDFKSGTKVEIRVLKLLKMHSKIHYMVWFVSLLAVSTANRANSQNLVLNGSFEMNNAPVGIDQIELSNTQFNNLLPHCHSFGTATNHHIDLMTNNQYNDIPLPQHGNWCVALQGGILNTGERFSMELSDSLEIGNSYQLIFYVHGWEKVCPAPVEIGISLYENDFGTLIYSSSSPSVQEWQLMLITFISTIKAKYITVRARECSDGWSTSYSLVDNFCLSEGEQCLELPEFKLPNIFTPNNDGINDVFKPVVYKGMKAGKLTVLNRWGSVIFETDDLMQGWDGTSTSSVPVSEGVYFWTAEYVTIFDEIKTEHGFLSVLR